MSKFKSICLWLVFLNPWVFTEPIFGNTLVACKSFYAEDSQSRKESLTKASIYLEKIAREQWNFYADNVVSGTNFLPSDNIYVENVQSKKKDKRASYVAPEEYASIGSAPKWLRRKIKDFSATNLKIANRTSPTNIGLYMLSTVTAYELGFISKEESLKRLRDTVKTIQALPKFTTTMTDDAGNEQPVEHLYNWYTIEGTPTAMPEKYISTVDNGNLAANLVTIISAIGDKDPTLEKDLRHILETMRFDYLYDSKVKAMYNGANIVNGKMVPTAGHYDMLISEVRSAYSVAIMMGQIPVEAWTRLKTKLGTELNNISTNKDLKFQSYTGTMFEYLMPSLFFKHEGTPLGAADIEAVAHQMAATHFGIWGQSEANSVTLHRYAAFGTPSLSQSREYIMNGDKVYAPYASQMATTLVPVEVAANLSKMDQLGLRERYGHFESVTIRGEGDNAKFLILPQYMAHHVGMGFIAIANQLLGNKIPEWTHESTYNKDRKLEQILNIPAEKYRKPSRRKNARQQNPDAYEARVTYKKSEIIGNGGFTAFIPGLGGSTWMSASGANIAISHNEVFYVRDNLSKQMLKLERPVTRTEAGKKFFDYQITDDHGGQIDISISVKMSALSRTKVSKVEIVNRTGSSLDLEVTGYVDWILDDANAYLGHPILRNLYTETKIDKESRVITARRRTMQGPEQERQFYGFFGLGQETAGAADLSTGSRIKTLGRLGNLSFPKAILEGRVEKHFGQTLDPAGVLAKNIIVEPGRAGAVDFVLGITDTADNIPSLISASYGPDSDKQVAAPTLPSDGTVERMQALQNRNDQSRRISQRPARPPQTDGKIENVIEWRNSGRTLINKDPFSQIKPWSMVLSNGKYGVVATHAGWAYSFGSNSQQGRVTPYRPDLTTEEPLRGIIVKDKKTGESWSISPNPAPAASGRYEVEVAPGYIKYKFNRPDGLAMQMTLFVAKDNPMEFWQVNVDNKSGADVDLELASFMKWAMGNQDPLTEKETVVTFDEKRGAYFAQSPRAMSPDSVGFHSVIGGSKVRRNNLNGTKDDPFHGLTTDLNVARGESKQLSFVLGLGENAGKSREYLDQYKNVAHVEGERVQHLNHIDSWMNGLQVKTPDESFNTMSNTWLLYQAYVAHMMGRSGFYQSGGAFGFRDQLQTAMNLVNTGHSKFWDLARNHIIESTRHQFEKGDVQHWWHKDINLDGKARTNYGQRSRISDNLLWLPLSLSHYIDVTGDKDILKEMTPFSVPSRDLRPGELDFAEPMAMSDIKVNVYRHAKLAIDLVLNERMGKHGLPLIGKGDWNDGLDRVGHLGIGESVWSAFFLYDILIKYSKIAQGQGDGTTAERYLKEAAKLSANIEEHAWNGKYYVRGFADNGEVLDFNDAIVAGWAVMSGAVDPERAKSALDHAIKTLYKKKDRMILLFDRKLENEVWGGSLQAYPFGSRENWAQYTHGSQWAALAALLTKYEDVGFEMQMSMHPTAHIGFPQYGGEPNSVAADISGAHKMGEAGWTWYSGAPGWLLRNNLETILGLKFSGGNTLRIQPTIPKKWPGFSVRYKHKSCTYEITVEKPNAASRQVISLFVDGVSYDPEVGFPLLDDGKLHEVKVLMGKKTP